MFGSGIVKGLVEGALGSLITPITDIWKKYIDKEITEEQLKSEVMKELVGVFVPLFENQAKVIMAETQSEDWLTRNWRPIVALTAFFSYWYVIIMIPHLWHMGLFGDEPIRFGEAGLENLFWLTTVCVGGYIGGRSLEKVTKTITGKWSK